MRDSGKVNETRRCPPDLETGNHQQKSCSDLFRALENDLGSIVEHAEARPEASLPGTIALRLTSVDWQVGQGVRTDCTVGLKTIRGRRDYLKKDRFVFRQSRSPGWWRNTFGQGQPFPGKLLFNVPLETVHEKERNRQEAKLKNERFFGFLATLLSMLYAIFVLFTGICFYVSDIFVYTGRHNLTPMFNIVLSAVGLAWLVWFGLDVQAFTHSILKYYSQSSDEARKIRLVKNEAGIVELDLPEVAGRRRERVVSEFYAFSTERIGGSYFMRIGATLFLIGHFLHLATEITSQVSFLMNDSDGDCFQAAETADSVFRLLYSLAMAYVTFQYSNVVINRRRILAKFALMHLVASCFCFWISAIVAKSFGNLVEDKVLLMDTGENERTFGGNRRTRFLQNLGLPSASPKAVFNEFARFDYGRFVATKFNCIVSNNLALRASKVSPFLYPFSIQFSLLVVAVWFVMWINVGKVDDDGGGGGLSPVSIKFLPDKKSFHDHQSGRHSQLEKDPPLTSGKFSGGDPRPFLTKGDLTTSQLGLASCLAVLLLCILGAAAYHVLQTSGPEAHLRGATIYLTDAVQSVVLVLMIVTSVKAYAKIIDLDDNRHRVDFMDVLLLLVCVPAHFIQAILVSVPSIYIMSTFGREFGSQSTLLVNGLLLVQIGLQTPMIVDGLRRCSNSASDRNLKPGRQLISFLIGCNLVLYLWEVLRQKVTKDRMSAAIEFYHPFFWNLAQDFCLPFALFYRFHSSVTLADIWTSAYQRRRRANFREGKYEVVRVLPAGAAAHLEDQMYT